MKYYFINNDITKVALPQGYAVSTDFNQRHKVFVELTDEQVAYHLANPTANVKKHAVQEFHKGDSYWRDGKKTVDRMWMVDRRNNFYKEDIRDKETGQVIHAVEEPLVKHVGHGSANKKKK